MSDTKSMACNESERPCEMVGPFVYCPIKGCGWTPPVVCTEHALPVEPEDGERFQCKHCGITFRAATTLLKIELPQESGTDWMQVPHHSVEIDILDGDDCFDSDCEHEARGEECPTHKVTYCLACSGYDAESEWEQAFPEDAIWPCKWAVSV